MTALSRQAFFLLPPLILGAWGIVFIHAAVSGRLATLLNPSFRRPAVICGAILLFLAVWHLLFFTQMPVVEKMAGPEPQSSLRGGLMQMLRGGIIWLILLAPVLVSAYYAPQSFSQTAVLQRALTETPGSLSSSSYSTQGTQQRESRSMPMPDPAGRPVYLEVSQVLDIGDNPDLTKAWEGKKVRTVAQFYPGEEPGSFRVVRFFMWCCASDSTALPVVVRGTNPLAGDLKAMDWCEVTGTVRINHTPDANYGEIELDSIQRCPRPAEPYLY